MKKLLSLLVIMVMSAVLLAGCGGKEYEIALITDKGNIDDKSFNQGFGKVYLSSLKNTGFHTNIISLKRQVMLAI